MVYICPPLDLSMENSMNNGMYPMEEVGFEVKSLHHVAHMPGRNEWLEETRDE